MKLKILILIIAFLLLNLRIFAQNITDIVLSDSLYRPSIVMDREGNFHMCFENGSGIYYQAFDQSMIPLTEPKKIKTTNSFSTSTALAGTDSKIMIAWVDPHYMIFNAFILGCMLDLKTGSLSSVNQIHDDYWDSMRNNPKLAALDDTTFIAIWDGAGANTGSFRGIYGKIFSTKLVTTGRDIWLSDISEVQCRFPKITVKPDRSGFWVFWRDNRTGQDKVYAREFEKKGTPKGSSFLVSEDNHLKSLWFLDATIDYKGNLTAVWGGDLEGIGSQIQLRRFDKEGNPFGPSENVTSKPGGLGQDPTVAIAMDSFGNSVVAWDQDDGNKGVKLYARRYSPENTPIGTAFRVSSEKEDFSQILPVLKMGHGKIFCFWYETKDSTVNRTKVSILDFNNPVIKDNDSSEGTTIDNIMLFQNYPNPFNPETTIRFMIKSRLKVKLTIYNMLGKRVKELINRIYSSGEYTSVWDGKNESGMSVSSGIYIYKIETENGFQQRKMVLLR